jgi:hypothetical protein
LDLDGQTDFHGPTALDVSLQQGSATPSIPLVEGISSIYPNPFNPSTGIKFCLEKEANARILIYNARGQIVRTLLDQRMPSGYHRETWDGTNELGQACGSGIYLTVWLWGRGASQASGASQIRRQFRKFF